MRTAIRSKASALPTPTPEVVIGYSNELMYDDFTEVGMFATLFISRYDPQKRELLYANAGHSPVIYCPAGGFAKLLEADGPAMGVLPISLSEDQPLAFNPGDVLVVATDGFNEASDPQGELFGYTRLLRIVETVAHKSAGEIAGVLFESVRAFSTGHRQDDDQTLLVIKGVAV
jgi:sigma-B regulation protein RsbU (phosphoserine phosphatase)